MTRTVVPPAAGTPSTGPGGHLRTVDTEGGDDLPTKLVKYIPGETLAFFVPAAALLGSTRDLWLVIVAVVGASGTAGYLWLMAQKETDPAKRPMAHFYVLAVLAFVVWAFATAPPLAEIVGIDEVVAGLLLAVGVFLIPLLDGVLNSVRGRR